MNGKDALGCGGIIAIILCCYYLLSLIPLKNDIEADSLSKNNRCIITRDGAVLEDHSLVIRYTMKSERFNILCYNELIADMSRQKVSNIRETRYARSSIISWNEEEYLFTIPAKNFVVTDSNVDTLLAPYSMK